MINNTPNPNTLSDHQVKIIVQYDPNMNPDFSDLRFTDGDGTSLIPHWIEDYNLSDNAIAWVKVPSIPANDNKTIYMYYDNPAAGSASSFDNTFTKDYNEPGLVGLWHMDDNNAPGLDPTVADSSAYGNDGTYKGSALSFDGIDDYVDIPDSDSLDITEEITLEAWVRINAFSTSEGLHMLILGKDSATERSYGIGVDLTWANPRKPFFVLFGTGGGYDIVWGTTELTPNTWYHLVGVADNSSLKLYLNGNLESTTSRTIGPIYAGTADLNVGAREYPDARCFFNGIIDEARIYNRALSQPEVSEHYRGIYSNQAGLVGLWHFKEGSGSSTADDSSQGNNGTIYGATWIRDTPPLWQVKDFALWFDGLDDYVDVGDRPSLDLGTSDFTIEGWFLSSNLAAQQDRRIVAKGTFYQVLFETAGPNKRLRLNISDGSVEANVFTSDYSLNGLDGQWIHFAFTVDRDGNSYGFINGVKGNAYDVSGVGSVSSDLKLYIGAYTTNNINVYGHFNGGIDELRIYTRALPEDEIFDHYLGIYPDENGLVGLWHFDEGVGLTAADASGYGNEGTIYGAAWGIPAPLPWAGDGGHWNHRTDVKFSAGSALRLNGVDDYVDVGDRPSLDLGTSDFTIEGWFISSDLTAQQDRRIVAKGTFYQVLFETAGPNKRLRLNISDGTVEANIFTGDYSLNGLDGQWVHFAFTVDRDGNSYGFINGVKGNAYDVSGVGSVSSDLKLYIGAYTTNNINVYGHFNGGIDELRIYTRALAEEEVKCHYQRRKYTSPEPTAIVGAPEPLRNVSVSISPTYQSGLNGETLSFTVTVMNTGHIEDNYDLTVTDDAGWGPSISPTTLTIPSGENRTAVLSVTIPPNAIGSTEDNLTVTATSQADPNVSDSSGCVAHATITYGVQVSISPSYQSGLNGATLTYTVTVTNTGNVEDTYTLAVSDNMGWGPSISQTSLTVPPFENQSVTLSVTVPLDAKGSTEDNLTVTATGTGVSDNASCIAHVSVVRGVEVSISPGYQSGLNGETLTYTITVMNTGNMDDDYSLAATDNAGWAPSISPPSLTVPAWENGTATLSVTVPLNATGCTVDNITVTATGTGVSDFNSCLAHATVFRDVGVSVSPDYQSGLNGATLAYTVTITNLGNVEDTYSLTLTDTEGWGPSVSPPSLTVAPWGSDAATLNVTIPSGAIGSTEDNISITATSTADPSVSDSTSCIAHVTVVRGVEVSISPSYLAGKPGKQVTYTLTVVNTGNVTEVYVLTGDDNSGWELSIAPSISVPPWENRTTMLSVVIADNVFMCSRDNVTVTAISSQDASVWDSDSCVAHLYYTWQTEPLGGKNAGWYASIAVDAADGIHVSYYDIQNKDLKYARWIGSSWVIETVDNAGDVGGWTSIALDSSGRPHISYYDFTNRCLKYARWTDSSWVIQTVDPAWEVGKFSSLALDSNDRAHIAYWDERNNHLKYARWTGARWEIERVDTIGDVGKFCSLALDGNDRAHISYYGNWHLKYAKRASGGWIKESIIRADISYGTSIALDRQGRPHIAYFDLRNADLMYAQWASSSWDIETIDSEGSVGWQPSIAVDNKGRARISYYDLTNSKVKYARWLGWTWYIENIDDANASYLGPTSLALDSWQLPHIVYLGLEGNVLKYAKDL
jgi:uncharacterized repeat protein (TIGR01451 family)